MGLSPLGESQITLRLAVGQNPAGQKWFFQFMLSAIVTAERKRSDGADFVGAPGLTLSSWLEAHYFCS